MAEVGRYWYNGGSSYSSFCDTSAGSAKVGSYAPNDWGLYDMHGNVWEWCLDWIQKDLGTAAVTDPVGAWSGNSRLMRGGCWHNPADCCRSARRADNGPLLEREWNGFRLSCSVTTGTAPADEGLYSIVDLSGGTSAASYPVSYLASVPSGGWTDEYKTTKLVLRKIDPGSFTMGSPADEIGHMDGRETQHLVLIPKGFYIGVFEVTQRQWELVMGNRPSYFNNNTYYASRPVELVPYNAIRGSSSGGNWPKSNAVDADSFLGKVRAKTGLVFDLPTEAQWEYACRAGTTTALNSGKNLTTTDEDANMAEIGRYMYNGGSYHNSSVATEGGTAKVGSYVPNAWGLYDMHGNVWEWCLDWWEEDLGTAAVTYPVGAWSGYFRLLRGGSWDNSASICRSAFRKASEPSYSGDGRFGFRLCCPAGSSE